MTAIRCLNCSAVIENPRPGQKFCTGSACRSAYWHKQHDPRCYNCGVPLAFKVLPPPSEVAQKRSERREVAVG